MNKNKDYLKKRNRGNKQNFKKKSFKDKDYLIDFKQKEEVMVETEINRDLIKIGKHWEGRNKIEPKNTSGKIYI